VPAAGAEAEHPAPVLKLKPAAGDDGHNMGTSTTETAPPMASGGHGSGDSDSTSTGTALALGIAGLVAGLAGLVLGGLAFVRTRRSS
jgi:hypothetical protein